MSIVWIMLLQARRKNHYVKGYQGDKGFTLLEVLFAVGLFSLLALFMTTALLSLNKWDEAEENSVERMEWTIFIRQLDREIQQASAWNVPNPRILSLQIGAEKMTYEPYLTIIRRRVGGEGHEVILQNVKDYSFQIKGDELLVRVQKQNGGTFEKKIYKRYIYEPSL